MAVQSAPGTQTAARALDVLVAVIEADHPPDAREVAAICGLERQNAYRLLRALEAKQFLARTGEHQYAAGPQLIRIAARAFGSLDIRTSAQPIMRTLVESTSETASLHIRSDLSRICIDTIEGYHAIRRVVSIGQSIPLHAGTTGKAITAFLAPDDCKRVLDAAETSGIDRVTLAAELAHVREIGFCAAVGDRISGVGGLSIPIFDQSGVVGAMTISGPGDRWNMAAMEQATPEALRQVSRLSAELGYVR